MTSEDFTLGASPRATPRMPYRTMSTPLQNRRSSSSSRSNRTPPGKNRFSTADDRGAEDHLELVDKTGSYRLRGEFKTINGDVVLGRGLKGTRSTLRPSASAQAAVNYAPMPPSWLSLDRPTGLYRLELGLVRPEPTDSRDWRPAI